MRASIVLETMGRRILVDCGPDFRTQALAHGIDDVDEVLLTHAHADHVGGLDDLRAYNLVHQHPITVYGTRDTLADIRERYAYCFRPPQQDGGSIPDLSLSEIAPYVPFDLVGGLRALPVPVFHGQLPILGFRFGSFAYLTDVSSVPETSVSLLAGVELLITSALRRKPHPTHMSLTEAVDFARRIGARQTWFTHMNHDLDHDSVNASLPPDIQLSYDGLTFEVPVLPSE